MLDHPLEKRCFEFALRVRGFCRSLKKDIANMEDIKQVVRASGSVAANYIEANENLGNKDLVFRVKICRKEAKECMLFLGLIETFGVKDLEEEKAGLIDEALQLKKIFSAMLNKIVNNRVA